MCPGRVRTTRKREMAVDINRLNTGEKVIGISGILLLIFSFFPWLGFSFAGFSESKSAWTFTLWPNFVNLNCGPEDGQGCGLHFVEQIGPGSPTVSTPPDYGTPDAADSWALLVVPPNALGSVDLTLTRAAQQP